MEPISALHVDDDYEDFLLLRALLTENGNHGQYSLNWASSSEEALEYLHGSDCQVVLVDYHLGSNTGLDLLKEARYIKSAAAMIMLTAASGPDVDVKAMEHGADDFLDKSDLSFAMLDRAIRYAVARKRQEVALYEAQSQLEFRVMQRTKELYDANLALEIEIQERIKAEKELSVREEYFRAIIENSQDIIAILNQDTTFRFVNSSVARLLGYSMLNLMGEPLLKLIPPAEQGYVGAELAAMCDSPQRTFTIQFSAVKKDGSRVYLETVGKNFLDHPAVRGFVINMRDITPRREAEDALRESEYRFRNLIEGSIQAILIHDGFQPLFVNQAFAETFGFENPEAVYAQPDIRPLFQGREKALEDGHGNQILTEVQATTPQKFQGTHINGREITLLGMAREVSWEGKRAVQATLIDVTKTEALASQLRQAQKMEAMGVLVAGVAHEVNNPNSFIRLNAETLRDIWEGVLPFLEDYEEKLGPVRVGHVDMDFLKSRIPRLTNGILNGAERIKLIVDRLKDFSRIDDADQTQDVVPNEVVRGALAILENRIYMATRNVSVNLADDLPHVRGNRQRLEQVLINLLVNACEALSDRQQGIYVESGFDTGRDMVQICIRDEGCGIPEAFMEKIQDPFFTTKREQKGTGLGLSVSSGIIQEHGGEMKFHSQEHLGTTVAVFLPVHPAYCEGGLNE